MVTIKLGEMNQTNYKESEATTVLQQIAQIETALFPYDAWSNEQIVSLFDNQFNHIIYAIEEGNESTIGYCIYQQIFEDVEILKIGTHPNYQQQGIASQLLKSMQQTIQLKNVQRIMLEVREDNFSAIGFYKKHGFEQISLRKNYYDNNDNTKTHAMIMQHTL